MTWRWRGADCTADCTADYALTWPSLIRCTPSVDGSNLHRPIWIGRPGTDRDGGGFPHRRRWRRRLGRGPWRHSGGSPVWAKASSGAAPRAGRPRVLVPDLPRSNWRWRGAPELQQWRRWRRDFNLEPRSISTRVSRNKRREKMARGRAFMDNFSWRRGQGNNEIFAGLDSAERTRVRHGLRLGLGDDWQVGPTRQRGGKKDRK